MRRLITALVVMGLLGMVAPHIPPEYPILGEVAQLAMKLIGGLPRAISGAYELATSPAGEGFFAAIGEAFGLLWEAGGVVVDHATGDA